MLNLIGERERLLNDERALDSEFKELLGRLPKHQHPQNVPQTVDMFMEWKGGLEEELEDWRNEVSQLSKGGNTPNSSPPVGSGWLPVSASTSENVVSRKPSGLWTPDGEEIEVEHWNQVLVRVVEWLIENGRLSEKEIKQEGRDVGLLAASDPQKSKEAREVVEWAIRRDWTKLTAGIESCGGVHRI